MNKFDSGAFLTPNGWVAFYRDARWAENRVLRDGKHDIIFATEQEAKDAGHAALHDHLNGHSRCEMMTGQPDKFEAAEALFSLPPIRRKGKVIGVETRRAKA